MIFFFIFLISCQNKQEKKKANTPNENSIPSSEHKKLEKSNPENEQQRSIKKPVDQDSNKKKLRALDTLKPITTVP
jgi:hypothetical protein